MQRLRRVVGNIVISLFGQAITWISTILLTVAYGRFLGDTKLGEFFFAITFVSLIGFPIEFGFNQQLTRDAAEQPEEASRKLLNTLALKILLWTFLYGLLIGLLWLLGYSPDKRLLIAICGITLLFTSITNTFASVHSAFERTYFSTFGSIFERVLDATAGIILLKMGAGVEVMALVLMVGALVDAIWQGVWCFHKIGLRLRLEFKLMLALFKSSIPFLVYGVLGVIYYRIDTVMLSLITNNDTVVGWYGAAYRLFDTLLFLPSLVISAIMYPIFSKLAVNTEKQLKEPVLSQIKTQQGSEEPAEILASEQSELAAKFSHKDEKPLKLAIEKTMNFVLFCAIPIATFLGLAAPQIIGFLYHSSGFTHSIPTLQALAPGLVFLYANSVLGAVLLSTHNERKVTLMALIALVFNVTSNAILIPHLAQIGTALVTSLTELVLLIISIILVPNRLLPVKSLIITLRILFAAAVMGACVWLLPALPLLVILPLCTVVYLVMAVLSQGLPQDDLRMIYQSLRNRKESIPAFVENMEHIFNLADLDTTPLPAITAMRPYSSPVKVVREQIDDDATIPRLTALKRGQIKKLTSTMKVEDEPTLLLPSMPKEIEDEPTLHLSVPKLLIELENTPTHDLPFPVILTESGELQA
jgi:O-antigen/teichoic acid export membrane protein